MPEKSDYGVTRFVSSVISGLGWVLFGLIALGTAVSFYAEPNPMILFVGVPSAISCLFLVAAGQLTRATVDNADNTREILFLLRNSLELASIAPKSTRAAVAAPAPAALPAADPEWTKTPNTASGAARVNHEAARCINESCGRLLAQSDMICLHCGSSQVSRS